MRYLLILAIYVVCWNDSICKPNREYASRNPSVSHFMRGNHNKAPIKETCEPVLLQIEIRKNRDSACPGQIKFKGDKGDRGEQGERGLQGNDGLDGMPGYAGPKGERGTPGNAVVGPRGLPGPRGDKGEIGSPGRPGRDGEKGSKGEPAGAVGATIKGEKGSQGLRGEKGDGGADGDKGTSGEKGEKGNAGPIGPPGPPGSSSSAYAVKGPKGDRGDNGPEGKLGEKGDHGDSGVKGYKGEKGLQGVKGLPGPPGATVKGERGKDGKPGQVGEKGEMGIKGTTGQKGEPGSHGSSGEKGDACTDEILMQVKGEPGKDGEKGEKGETGSMFRSDTNSGIVIVRHSQSNEPPKCNFNFFNGSELWSGYSISYKSYNHDLGSPSSCLRKFPIRTLSSCEPDEKNEDELKCTLATSSNRSIWLSATDDVQQFVMYDKTRLNQFVSRCSVCEVPLSVIVVHSENNSEAVCPKNWIELWSGYSFSSYTLQHTDANGDKTDEAMNIQSLAGPGSCLQHFRKKPFVECNDGEYGGKCGPSKNTKIAWMVLKENIKQSGDGAHVDVDNFVKMINRCKVCIRN